MQAIILAAGMGKRLGDLTQNNTKCMIKVNGITLIERMLKQLDRLNLNKIVLVIGYEGLKLQQYISTIDIKTKIEYVENRIYDKTNNIYSLYLAKDKLQEDDTILLESDLIFEDEVLNKLIYAEYSSLALVAKFESWMDGTVVTLDEELNIKSFITTAHFKFEEIPNYFKTVNIYKFSKEFSRSHYIPFLEAYSKALGNNEYYEQVLKVITLLEKPEIKALPLEHEKWYEIDDIQDLDIAESVFANSIEDRLEQIEKRYGGYWRYPNLIDFSYLVNPYFPNEKLKAEIKANFNRLLSEYPSGLRVNSLLAAKYFKIKQDYICVGNGAAELIKGIIENLHGNIGICYPTFEEYPNRKLADTIIKFIPNNKDFKYNANDIINFFQDKHIKSLLLVNPDNPSGNFIPKKELFNILNWCLSKDITIIIDESFVDFTDDFRNNSLITNQILENYNNLIVIKSISKSYGVPGLRLGVATSSNKELIIELKKSLSIWNINSFAEFYLQIFGKYEKAYFESCEIFINTRNQFYSELQKIPFIRVIESQANYFLCEIKSKYTSRELTCLLLDNNILIKDCSKKEGFNNLNYIRIAIRDVNDNNRLVSILKSF